MQNVQIIFNCDTLRNEHPTEKQIRKYIKHCMNYLDMPEDIHLRIEILNTIIMNGIAGACQGLAGRPHGQISSSNPYTIEIKLQQEMFKALAHEMVHIDQYQTRRFQHMQDCQTRQHVRIWKGKVFDPEKIEQLRFLPDQTWSDEKYKAFKTRIPWEREAYKLADEIHMDWERQQSE